MLQPHSSDASSIKQLITMRLGAAGFAQHWKHCDLVANYLGRFTSELLQKSDSHANLVSTVLNELLEVVFRRNAGKGEIEISITGDSAYLVVKILVPVNEEQLSFYQDMTALVQRSDVAELYQKHLTAASLDENLLTLSLLELATSYQAVLQLETLMERSRVLLCLPFPVEP